MEKIELKVTMEPERLDALRYFLSAKEKSTPEKELQRALDQLYEKCVPEEMREYLDSKCKPTSSRPMPRRCVNPNQECHSPQAERAHDGALQNMRGGTGEEI